MDGKPKLRKAHHDSGDGSAFDFIGSAYDGDFDDDLQLGYDTDENEYGKKHEIEFNEDRDTFFTLVKCYIGAGFLGLPFAFKNAGWLGGILCLLLATTLSAYTASVLGLAKEEVLKDETFMTSSKKRPGRHEREGILKSKAFQRSLA